MNEYKTFDELKEELGNNYDLFMYEINLQLLMKIDKAIEYIENNYPVCAGSELLDILKGDDKE